VSSPDFEGLLRELAPQALAALVRHYGDFGTTEDALQEALLAATVQWPEQGIPDNPRGWLIAVAARRLIDWRRRDATRRSREAAAVDYGQAQDEWATGPDEELRADHDDSLALLFLCCHPALSPPAQVALTLRAIGGLSTPEIAAAYLVPEATMAQRIVRAKHRIRATRIPFAMPPPDQYGQRLAVVLRVLYLIFNEGYTATSGPRLHRTELTTEAIRLTRQLYRLRPSEGEVAGLLALMLLTEARRDARTDHGALVPLSEQDRGLWNQTMIREGSELVAAALAAAPIGPYQIQAAIAAVHTQAASARDTDWPQILALYGLLESLAPSPVVTLNRAVATAMVHGPDAGLALLDTLDSDPRLAHGYRLAAVRAHLLELRGDVDQARAHYHQAARVTTSQPERHYLQRRANALRDLGADRPP